MLLAAVSGFFVAPNILLIGLLCTRPHTLQEAEDVLRQACHEAGVTD